MTDVKKWHDQLTSKQKAAYQKGLQGISGNKSEADGFINSSTRVNGFQIALDKVLGNQPIEDFTDCDGNDQQ